MNNFLKQILNVIKKIFGFGSLFLLIVCIFLLFDKDYNKDVGNIIAGIIMCLAFAILSYFLLRKKKDKQVQNSIDESCEYQTTINNVQEQSVKPPIQSKPVTTNNQVKPVNKNKIFIIQANDYLRIITDCLDLLEKTKNPDTFFSRYGVLSETVSKAVELNKKANLEVDNFSRVYFDVTANKQNYIFEFLKRYWSSIEEKSAQLKTEKAKQRHYQKFYDSLEPYKDEMNEANINFYTSIYKSHSNKGE